MVLKRAAIYIGNWIWNSLDESQKVKNEKMDLEEIQNRLKVILLYIVVAITLLLFGWISGMWLELSLSFISFVFIRWWNGGHHFSVDICYIVTVSVILGIIPLSYMFQKYQLVIVLSALIMNMLHAPFNSEDVTLKAKKLTSMTLCLLSFYVNEIFLTMWFILGFDLIKIKEDG